MSCNKVHPEIKKILISILLFFIIAGLSCSREFDNPVDTDVDLGQIEKFSAQQDGEWIRIFWDFPTEDISGYKIERKTESDGFHLLSTVKNPNTKSYLDTSITCHTMYVYKIYGFLDENHTAFSPEITITAKFPAPYHFQYEMISDTSIGLSWQDSSGFEDGFSIERCILGDSVWLEVGQTGPDQRTFIDDQLFFNLDYRYRVYARTAHNQSAFSEELPARIFMSSPELINLTPLNDHEIKVDWSDNNQIESGFLVERKSTDGSEWQERGSVRANSTTYIDDSLSTNILYSYRVAAVTAKNRSGYSEVFSAQTSFPVPSNFRIIDSDQQTITLGWNDLDYEEGYILSKIETGQIDTLKIQLDANTTEHLLSELDSLKRYRVGIRGISSYNQSEERASLIDFGNETLNLNHTFSAHSDTVLSLAFSPDNLFMASSGKGNDVKIWQMGTWTNEKTIINEEVLEPPVKLSFLDGGNYLAAGYEYSYLKLFETGTWIEYKDVNPANYPLYALAYNDIIGMTAAAKYKYIYVLSMDTWSLIKTFSASDRSIMAIDFGKNGDWMAASSGIDNVKIWDTSSWLELKTLSGHADLVMALNTSPSGNWLASGSKDHSVIIWRTDNWSELHTMTDHTSAIRNILFSPDNRWLASIQEDNNGEILVCDTQNWTPTFRLQITPENEIKSLAFSPSSQFLTAGDATGKIWIWEFKSNWVMQDLP